MVDVTAGQGAGAPRGGFPSLSEIGNILKRGDLALAFGILTILVVMLFEARGVAGVMSLMIGLLAVQIVTVWTLGIEPRQRSLEELKPDETVPAVLKEVS